MALFVAEPADDVAAAALAAALALALGLPLVGMFALPPIVHVAFVAEVPVAEAGFLVGVLAFASLPVVLRWGAGWVPTRVLGGRWRSSSLSGSHGGPGGRCSARPGMGVAHGVWS